MDFSIELLKTVATEFIRLQRINIDVSSMTVYSACMTFSTCLDWSLSFQAERCFAGCSMLDSRYSTSLVVSLSNPIENRQSRIEMDTEDVRLSRRGDGEAYRRLIERHQEHVSRIMWRFSRDRRLHEELVQDVFVEAYLSLASYREKAPFAHWLARIATRVGYAYLKQKAGRHVKEEFTLQEWDQIPDDSTEQIEPGQAAELLYRLLAQLPPRDHLVLTLRYLEDCDISETARRTGWSKAMVKVQTWRARKKLQKLFEKAGKEIL
jgi:RNA polymerase sigma-70 factor (ECF subfamily)